MTKKQVCVNADSLERLNNFLESHHQLTIKVDDNGDMYGLWHAEVHIGVSASTDFGNVKKVIWRGRCGDRERVPHGYDVIEGAYLVVVAKYGQDCKGYIEKTRKEVLRKFDEYVVYANSKTPSPHYSDKGHGIESDGGLVLVDRKGQRNSVSLSASAISKAVAHLRQKK